MLLAQVAQRRRAVCQAFGIGLAPRRIAIHVPVRRTVDAIRVRPLIVSTLQAAPDEVLQVVLERLDFLADRGRLTFLAARYGAFERPGSSQVKSVHHAVQEDVRILDRARDLGRHVVRCRRRRSTTWSGP